jgi:parvulin-like peptidyl-prolyl isomerase
MAKQKAAPRLTRKHLARAQRDRLMARLLIVGVGLVLAAVVLVVGYGILEQQVLIPRRPVVTVNGDKISRQELTARTALAGADLGQQRRSAEQMLSFFADNPQVQQSLQQQIAQIDAKLNDPNAMASQTLQGLIRARLIRQEAERRGLTVSDADVQRAIEEAFGFYADGTPTPAPTATVDATLAAQSTATLTPSATATLAVTETPVASATPANTATAGPSPTPRPTATAYTRQSFEADWQKYLDDVKTSLGVDETYVRDRFVENLYQDRLRASFRDSVPHEEEQVWAKHILVADESTALGILARLKQGESWDVLAAGMSLDTGNKDNGGDLGWFSRGSMVDAFETAAFAGKVGEVVGPVQTQFGWHLIKIVDHAVRRLDGTSYEAAVDQALSVWLSSALAQADLVYDPSIVAPTATAGVAATATISTPAASTPDVTATP